MSSDRTPGLSSRTRWPIEGGHLADVWALVHAERAALIEDLELLDTAAWQEASLRRDWTVHDVVAHLVDTARTTRLGLVIGLARARFDFDHQNARGVEPAPPVFAAGPTRSRRRRHPSGAYQTRPPATARCPPPGTRRTRLARAVSPLTDRAGHPRWIAATSRGRPAGATLPPLRKRRVAGSSIDGRRTRPLLDAR